MQAVYASYGIATFPFEMVDGDKKPMVKNYWKSGLPASASYARRFADAPGIGFMTNHRNRIAALDIGTPDNSLVAKMQDMHGETPVISGTPSGGKHLYYRYNGEHRHIRPFAGLPVDLLGYGGLIVVAPSQFEAGQYRLLKGSLNDFDRLPVMRGIVPSLYVSSGPHKGAAGASISGIGDSAVKEGYRNQSLFHFCLKSAKSSSEFNLLLEKARTENMTYLPSLADHEVAKVASNAWGYEISGINGYSNPVTILPNDEIDKLMDENIDAYVLLSKLKRHNWK